MTKPAILIIGGKTRQCGIGIEADIQTVTAHGCQAIPLFTTIEQSPSNLAAVGALHAEQFMRDYHACAADVDIVSIKIGLIPNLAIAQCVKKILEKHNVTVIWDPILASTPNEVSVSVGLQQFMTETMLKDITLLTLNAADLRQLTGCDDVADGVKHLLQNGLFACVVSAGYDDKQYDTDYFSDSTNSFYCYAAKREINVSDVGCVLASSIACNLALQYEVRDAVILAKAYITRGIRNAYSVGGLNLIKHSSEPFQLEDIPRLSYSENEIGLALNFPPCPTRLGIYPVVDSCDWVHKLVVAGVKTIQLRIKGMTNTLEKQQVIKQAIAHSNATVALFINDYWQEAISCKAYGVHLGQEDLLNTNLIEIEKASLRLGVSTHSYWELARALAISPSYIALGPIFATTSKIMPWVPQGEEVVRQWVQLLGDAYPLVAIGGIDLPRAKQLHETGVGSVAMISAITKADDYKAIVRDLLALWSTPAM